VFLSLFLRACRTAKNMMIETMISAETPPTTPPTIATVFLPLDEVLLTALVEVGPPGSVSVLCGFVAVFPPPDEVSLTEPVAVGPPVSVFCGFGNASGSLPTLLALLSSYNVSGNLVTLKNAHRGTAVPCGISPGYLFEKKSNNTSVAGTERNSLCDIDIIAESRPYCPTVVSSALARRARHDKTVHHGIAITLHVSFISLIRGEIAIARFQFPVGVGGPTATCGTEHRGDFARILAKRIPVPFQPRQTHCRQILRRHSYPQTQSERKIGQ
jgi:hypothetical protein